jgi:hypothetical protein
MSIEERTMIQAECTAVTATAGRQPGECEQELTLSDEPTLFWSPGRGAAASSKPNVPRATQKQPRLALRRAAKPSEARLEWATLASEKLRFPPTDLKGALAWGAFVGLVLASGFVTVVRGNAFRRTEVALTQPRNAEVRVWTKTEAGSPVSGARVWVGEEEGTTDAQGRYVAAHTRKPQASPSDEVQVKVECPRGYVGRETRRAVRWTGVLAQPSGVETRELTFYCEVELVELVLDLAVERGEARFRLGDRELGTTEGGRLRREVLVPAHSEQVLTAEPELGPKQRPPLRVVGATRVFQVGERPAAEEHTVKLIWPQTRSGVRRAVPYRL